MLYGAPSGVAEDVWSGLMGLRQASLGPLGLREGICPNTKGPLPNPMNLYGLVTSMAPKSYEFIGFGDLHGPKPYKFIGFGDIHGYTAA